jgi:hypothetical protein
MSVVQTQASRTANQTGLGIWDLWLRAANQAARGGGPLLTNRIQEYWVDAAQRYILTLDALRQRGNNYLEQAARITPAVLNFDSELLMDGRTFERPVNYGLVRIKPPAGVTIDPTKRPFIVFDPRAGQGPGIGGMKHDSEIGEVLQAGHPCYFVGFLADPVPGQTIEDVCEAEARFVARVGELHVDTDGKPCLIGNCQAGWQVMIMSSVWPDLVGPVMLAGSPLSYWAGIHGKGPMRYTGGLLGGTWLTAFSGDLGNGLFDGAHLVANFESLHPSNTYWKKIYNLYSHVDTEAPRFLEFEKWWGNPILLNAAEMQWMVDQLFVGNKLASGELCTSNRVRIDLRNVKGPIIVFCSWGDDITPPQQALGWILDLYDHEDELIANGQTIVYTLHHSIGHLGIFVSGKVATKEDKKLVDVMDMIDLIPPGLYEAVITNVGEDADERDLIKGRYRLQIEPRTLGHIRALGVNNPADEKRFATVRAVSEVNLGLYRTFLSPLVRSLVTQQSASLLRRMHPNRLAFEMFADTNPFMRPIALWAESVRAHRHPVSTENTLTDLERAASDAIVKTLDVFTDLRNAVYESVFMAIYDSPLLQALVGLRADGAQTRHYLGREVARETAFQRVRAELSERIEQGSVMEAALRAAIYVQRRQGTLDERCLTTLKEMNSKQPPSKRISLLRFKEMVKEQYLILLPDEERAIDAIPKLLPPDRAERDAAIADIRRIFTAIGPLNEESARRLSRVEALFGVTTEMGASPPGKPRKLATLPAG